MAATLSAFSMDITRTGVQVSVPTNDLAFLMYYLCCVTVDIGLNILDDDLVDYENYGRLSDERRALVLEYARKLSPQELIDKVIFRDDQGVIINHHRNEFCDISVACGVVSVQRDICIAGKMQSVTKVMFYEQSWLDDHYNRPIERAAAQKRLINPYFRGITLYLAPLLYLTALFLSIFVYLSPAAMLHDQVALLTVTATAPAQPGPTDGLRLILGALGLPQFFRMTRAVLNICLRCCQARAQRKTTRHRCNAQNPSFILSMASSYPFFFSLNNSHRTNRSIHFAIFYARALHSSSCSQRTSHHRLLPWLYFPLFRLVYPDSLPLQDGKGGPNV